MSLYYFNIQALTKNTHSVVAKSAYISGEHLYSERDLETKAYKTREVAPESFILAPEHAPEWVYNHERLWNEVERVEVQKNARIAKEIKVALPIELSNEEQTKLVLEFANENLVERGIVADISIHRDREENPHAHILITTRPFDGNGEWGNKKKKEYIKDQDGNFVFNENGKKKFETIQLTDWDKKETLLEWRRNFAQKINEYYLKNGINISVSHESYEKQGLDKLPKQRLSREEYAIEEKAKQNARIQGKEYIAVTHYGKLNQEIENTNKKLEIINQKVVSLSDYKKHVENEQHRKLNEIRKNYNLSEQDWKSLKVVGNRISGFVDYKNAKENLDKLNNWKKKIDYVGRLLKAEERVLAKAKLTHEREVSKTLLFGFIPNKFDEEFNNSLQTFKSKIEAHGKSLETFNELYSHSLRAYEIQKEFTNEEFKFLYPNYQHLVPEENEVVFELEAKYVELFRNEGQIRNAIPELDGNSHKLSNDYVRLESLVKDWKETKNSLMILNRTTNKKKDEIKEHYQNYNSSKLYQAQILYTDASYQLSNKEEHKTKLQESLNNEMIRRYPGITLEVICEIPSDVQSKMLALHLTNENTGKLSQDLKLVQDIEKSNQKHHDKDKNQGFENSIDHSGVANDSGALFNTLIGMAQSQENRHDDLEDQRKRKKKQNKLYREMGEQEM